MIYSKIQKMLNGAFFLSLTLPTAQAAVIDYEVSITIDDAAVQSTSGAALGLGFSYFATGAGTYDTNSGSLQLNTSGLSCQGGAGAGCKATYAYGTHGPWAAANTGYLALGSAEHTILELQLDNPTARPEDGSLLGLTYAADKTAGTFTIPLDGSPAWVPPVATIGIMKSNAFGYAAKVLEGSAAGTYELNGWFLFSEGIFGATASHVESQVGEALYNGTITLTPTSIPPTTEVPEPTTALIFGAGMLASYFKRKQSSLPPC